MDRFNNSRPLRAMQSSRRRNLFFLAEPCRPGDYEPRKAKILRRLGGAAVIVGALLGTLLAALLLGIPAEYIDFKAALKQIFSNSNILGKTLQEHLNAFIDEYVLLVSAVVGAGYGFFQLRKAKVGEKELRQIIFERCFDVFNADALAPIRGAAGLWRHRVAPWRSNFHRRNEVAE